MILGSTPAHPRDTIFAMGLSLYSFALYLDIRSIAVAPAFNGEEFPGVITPSGLKDGFRDAVASRCASKELDDALVKYRGLTRAYGTDRCG